MERILPYVMMLISAVILAFGIGVFITEYKLPPYRSITAGAKTLLHTYKGMTAAPYVGQFVGVEPDLTPAEAPGARFSATPRGTAYPGNFVVIGGLNEYLDICPGDGCIAVEFDRAGNVVHGYPYLPDEIFAADITGGSYYREGQPADPRLIKRPIGMRPLPDGDIVISFQTASSMFPFAGGIARIARDGTPRWYRFDYSHHWVNTMPDGRLVVPDLEIQEGNWTVRLGPKQSRRESFCETGRPQVDGVHILDTDGAQVQRIDVNAALRASPWAGMLTDTFAACDPLHINFVDALDDTAPGGDLAPGNLLISLRNLNAVVVLDPRTDTVTRVIKGSFQQQHSVQQLSGSKALVFDNWGAAGHEAGGGSRLLEIDLAGGPERQIFPLPGEPAPEFYSHRAGHLDIAPDLSRAFVSFTETSGGVEVDLASGEVLMTYDSLHDLSGVEAATEAQRASAARAKLFGMYYLQP